MKLITKLDKIFLLSKKEKVIGKPVAINEEVVGKVVDYNPKTGEAVMEIENEEAYNKLVNTSSPIGISSKPFKPLKFDLS